jgi:hypothetical protein
MPYQVRTGALTIVATNSVEALRVFDSLTADTEEPVFIRDMDGVEIDPDRIRCMSSLPE